MNSHAREFEVYEQAERMVRSLAKAVKMTGRRTAKASILKNEATGKWVVIPRLPRRDADAIVAAADNDFSKGAQQ